MKRNIICLMAMALVIGACGKRGSQPEVETTQERDADREYELLSEKLFSSAREGEETAQEYIDYFSSRNSTWINNANEIKSAYRRMDAFFSKAFDSYATFKNESRNLDSDFSLSRYEGVRKLWKQLYEQEERQLMEELMENITVSSFDEYFRSEARSLSDKEFMTWEVESIDQVSVTTPSPVEDKWAKEATGEYRIHLRKFGMFRTGDALLSIEGRIGITDAGELQFFRKGYHFVETPVF